MSTPLLVPMSLAIYALARPQQTAAEYRTRRLAHELVDQLENSAPDSCLSCGSTVDPGWLRCPSCTTWLALPCATVRRLVGSEPARLPVLWQRGAGRARRRGPPARRHPFARARAGARSGRSARDARPPCDRASGAALAPGRTTRAGPDALMVRRRANRKAAAGGMPAAASWVGAQPRDASSARPRSYAASRDTSSASS